MRTLAIILLGLTIFSCNQSQTTRDKNAIQNPVAQTTTNKRVKPDTISGLLEQALKADTLEFSNWEPFLFFKSGNFLSKTEKNVIIVHCPTDTMYSIELYSIKNNKWLLSDSVSGLDALPTQFDRIFDDYNFDGQTDVYIQVTASNGWPLSRGHLLIVDPLTKKLIIHKEARELANMKPDPKTKTIISELWNGYNMQGQHQLTIFTNKWINGELKTIKKMEVTLKGGSKNSL